MSGRQSRSATSRLDRSRLVRKVTENVNTPLNLLKNPVVTTSRPTGDATSYFHHA